MTNINYLCIDDQQDSTIDALLDGLRKNDLNLLRHTPKDLKEQMEIINNFVQSNKNSHIGLLLDLRLDTEADSDGNKVAYRGPTLAQELRTRMAEKSLQPFPITLWSVDAKIQRSYKGDESSHDLFDDVFQKDGDVSDNPADVARKLISLADGYIMLSNIRNHAKVLGLNENDQDSYIYAQFLADFESYDLGSTHELAQIILNELIRKEGLLVSEELVAARLGVDIVGSKNSWKTLINYLKAAEYSGPFSQAWTRWWWFRIEDLWNEIDSGQKPLHKLNAKERVDILNKKWTLELLPAQAISPGYSTKFWAICVGTLSPLDPVNGLKVVRKSLRGWHDNGYVSIYAALERLKRDVWKLDPLERDRFEIIKYSGE